jgi:hypothetical protein
MATLKLTALKVFDELFFLGRPARSEAYRRGVGETLEYNVDQLTKLHPVFYKRGTAEFDAYFAGATEALAVLENKIKTGEWKP